MDDHKSNIRTRAERGQNSKELAERNSGQRLIFYGTLGAVAGGVIGSLAFPAFAILFVFIGFVCGLALSITIDQRMERTDSVRRSQVRKELAQEEERETLAKIEAAKARGDFDRWKKDE